MFVYFKLPLLLHLERHVARGTESLAVAAQREKEILRLSGHSDVSDVLSVNYIHLLYAYGRSCFKCI